MVYVNIGRRTTASLRLRDLVQSSNHWHLVSIDFDDKAGNGRSVAAYCGRVFYSPDAV